MMLPAAFGRYLPAIEAEMRRAVGGERSLLYGMIRYHLGWEDRDGQPSTLGAGKALRPVLCALVCDALCGSPEPALPAAAAIELLHNFSLVHDDIEDGDATRRGQPTAWTVWGVPQAINGGDGLWAVSSRTLLRAAESVEVTPATLLRAMSMLNDASLTMIEGQALDIGFETRDDVTTDDYLDMISRKTGALIERSITLGALFGGADGATLAAFERYGALIGRIFQIRDDVLGVWGAEEVTGKSATGDIRKKKKSYPVVHALSSGTPAAEELRALYATPELDDADVRRATALIEQTGARPAADQLARDTHRAASDVLDTLPLHPAARADLDEMGRFLLERKK